MDDTHTVSATEFKAKCLDMLDRIGNGEWESVAITKHGRVVAMLVPPAPRLGRRGQAARVSGTKLTEAILPDICL